MSDEPRFQRTIRSFVKREGKITTGQEAAIERLWPQFGVDFEVNELDMQLLFGRDHFRVMEIGFGNGLSLAEMAEAHPEQDFFGVEVHRPGVGSLLVQVGQRGLDNVRVSQEDAVQVLSQQVPAQSLDRLQIFFPDPWHKKRHHKRRLIQPEFLSLAVAKLKCGGRIHVATDWENYAEHILRTLEQNPYLSNCFKGFAEKPEYRPTTKYEIRGQRLGHEVWDLIFQRND